MILDSIGIERFKEKDLNERQTPQNDMESSVSVPRSPPQSKPMDLNASSTVTSVPRTKMASPSTPHYPSVTNYASVLETPFLPHHAVATQFCPSTNSFPSQSSSMGMDFMSDVDRFAEEAADAKTSDPLPCDLINKSAVILPSISPNGQKSPTSLPDEPKEHTNPPLLALFDRTFSNNKETAASKDSDFGFKANGNEGLTPKLANESDLRAASVAKSSLGIVLTCHDRLETALTPKNIIEYKSMDDFPSPTSESDENVGRSVKGLSKEDTGSTPAPRSDGESSGSRSSVLKDNVEYSSAAGQSQLMQSHHLITQTTAKSMSPLNDSGNNNASVFGFDRINTGNFPTMTQTNVVVSTTQGNKDLNSTDVTITSTEKNVLESAERPNCLDLSLPNKESSNSGTKKLSKSASKCLSGEKLLTRSSSASLSVSQNKIKSGQSESKRNIDSPTKPKIITKSPSRDKPDKRLFRYTIGVFPGSPQSKTEDGGGSPLKAAAVLPSKPKTLPKSPSADKMDKRLYRSTSEVSSTLQDKMAEKASVPKAGLPSPTKPRTGSKSPTVNYINKNISDLSKMAQTKMADVTSVSKPLTKSPSIDKLATKKALRKEKSCPVESSPVEVSERRPSLRPPWRGGAWASSQSQTNLSVAQSGFIRRSESSMSVNAGLRSRAGLIRPATSLPHIPKSSGSRPCLLVALRPTNVQQERERFFQSDFSYDPQFEYEEVDISPVLDKYKEGSDLFLQQAVGIMECVLRKYGSYENFEEVTGGNVLPKSQVWAAVRKYLQKEGCVGEVVVRLSDELLSQAVMVVENCRPTLTINLSGARQHWLEGMLRHEIGTHYLRGVNNSLQPWASSEHRKALGLKGVNPTEEGLASLHSVLLRKQPYLWRAALLYFTVHHAAAMSFSQLFHHIQRFVHSPDVRWEYCLRAKRGQTDTSRPGCFSKDQVYLDGILRILRHRRNIDFQLLTALGKVSFEDVERLRPLASLSRTRIPHFMSDTERYLAQLDHILQTNELKDEELRRLLP